jgi:hypothetical protein
MLRHYHNQFWKANAQTFFEYAKKDLFNVSLSKINNTSQSNLNQSDMELLRHLTNSKVLTSEIKGKEGESDIQSSKFTKEKNMENSSKVKESVVKVEKTAVKDQSQANPYLPEEISTKKSNIQAAKQV